MKRLLLIAYYFPPDGGPGSQRPAKFARYLPEFGWRPTIVTREEGHSRGRWDPPDPSMLHDLRPGLDRISVAGGEIQGRFARWLAVDRMQGWADVAGDAICGRFGAGEWDAALVTMSPFSLARLAMRLKLTHSAPVILDLRDPWALDPWMTFPTALHRAHHLRLMRRSLRLVDGVIANTPEAAKRIASKWPTLATGKIITIPNGYDETDFAGAAPRARTLGDEIIIVHSGSLHSASLYPDSGLGGRFRGLLRSRAGRIDRTGRTIKPFLDALDQLGSRQPTLASRVRLHLVGLLDDATLRSIREHQRGGQVIVRGYLPHVEAVHALVGADGLLLPLHGAPGGERSLIVPGKTYEYLAADRPILGCLPPGDARDLVARSDRGHLADPIDSTSIAASLEEMIRHVDRRSGADGRSLPEWIRDLDRRRLTERLAGFLSSMTHEAARAGAAA